MFVCVCPRLRLFFSFSFPFCVDWTNAVWCLTEKRRVGARHYGTQFACPKIKHTTMIRIQFQLIHIRPWQSASIGVSASQHEINFARWRPPQPSLSPAVTMVSIAGLSPVESCSCML
ncbi:hypothetical protein J3F84DRAFT_361812 [Trichoderma pleuroticola]